MKRKILALIVVLVFIGVVFSLRRQPNETPTPLANNIGQPPSTADAPAITISKGAETEQERRYRMMTSKTNRNDFHLSEVDIYRFLEASRTNALSLVTSFEASHNKDALKAAAEKFPNDPLVQAKVIMHDVFPEDRAKWVDAFKKSSPDNSLPNLFAAQDRLKAGDVKGALSEIKATEGKTFNDYTRESAQGLEEAYLLAGRSITEAKTLGASEALTPHLAPINAAATSFNDLAARYAAAGDTASQLQLLRASWEMGDQLRGHSPAPLMTDMMGLSIQNNSLRNWPAGTPAPFLDRPVADEVAANVAYRNDIRSGTTVFDQWFPTAPEVEVVAFMDRSKTFGERDAMNWLRDRHPELAKKSTP